MNEFLLNLLSIVLIPVLGVLTTYAVSLIKYKISEVEERVKDERLKKYLGMAEDAIISSVATVGQTYVDALKKENAFTKEAQKAAFNKAKGFALEIIGERATSAVKSELGDAQFAAWVNAKLETAVRNN